jgi:hypothetical protein
VAPCLPLTLEEQFHYDRIYAAFMWIAYYIPIAISSAGIVVNTTFLYFTIKGIYQRSLTSNLYLFLINKSIGDLVPSISFCIYLTLELKKEIGTTASLSMVLVAGFSYWSASITYLALSLVKFLAIKKPLLYRRKFTSKLIIKVLLALWPVAIFTATTNPYTYLLINRNETCLQFYNGPFAIINASAHEICFLLVFIICTTVLSLANKHKSERQTTLRISEAINRSSKVKTVRTSYRIMLTGFLVYSFCYFFTVILFIITMIWGSDYCETRDSASECENDRLRVLSDFFAYYRYVLVLTWFFYFRCLIDPVINIVIDKKMRALMKKDLAIFGRAAKFCFKL